METNHNEQRYIGDYSEDHSRAMVVAGHPIGSHHHSAVTAARTEAGRFSSGVYSPIIDNSRPKQGTKYPFRTYEITIYK